MADGRYEGTGRSMRLVGVEWNSERNSGYKQPLKVGRSLKERAGTCPSFLSLVLSSEEWGVLLLSCFWPSEPLLRQAGQQRRRKLADQARSEVGKQCPPGFYFSPFRGFSQQWTCKMIQTHFFPKLLVTSVSSQQQKAHKDSYVFLSTPRGPL